MTIIAGIDPGLSGAIAKLSKNNQLISVSDMPVKKVGKKNKINGSALAEILENVNHVIIEDVGSRPGQGIVSAFTFGEGFGVLKGVCEALSISYSLVRPNEWQKHFGLNTGKKDKSIKKQQIADKCLSIYPDADLFGFRGGLKDGRSDAIMIAHFGLSSDEL